MQKDQESNNNQKYADRYDRDEFDFANRKISKIQTGLLIFAVVFAGIAAVFAGFAWDAAKDQVTAANREADEAGRQADEAKREADAAWEQVKVAREIAFSAQRAWIAPFGIKIAEPFMRDTDHEVRLTFGNPGKEPAQKINWKEFWSIALPSKDIHDPDAVNAAILKVMRGIECRDQKLNEHGPVAYPSGPESYYVRVRVAKDEVNLILDRKAYLLIAGCFTYETFGKRHHSFVCRFFDSRVDENSMKWPSTACFVGEYAD